MPAPEEKVSKSQGRGELMKEAELTGKNGADTSGGNNDGVDGGGGG